MFPPPSRSDVTMDAHSQNDTTHGLVQARLLVEQSHHHHHQDHGYHHHSHNPQLLQSWWRTAPSASVDRDAALHRFRSVQDDVRRQDQNRWLGKHAKRRRFEFSAEQKRMLKQWFNALDSDGSGKISVEELEDPMLSIGIVSDKSQIKDIVGHLDKDGSGSIDFAEFVEFLTPHARPDKSALDKHEQMFMLLTKKMEHQSAGFLGINTQLSMERRRFILEAITHPSSDTLLDDIALLNVPTVAEKHATSPVERHRMRHQRLVSRQKKLEALDTQNQVDQRFEALQEVLNRNANAKLSNSRSLPQLSAFRGFHEPQAASPAGYTASRQSSLQFHSLNR